LTIAKLRNLARGSIFVQILLPVIAVIVIVAAANLIASNYVSPNQDPQFPVMTKNTNFRIKLVVSNLSLPTSMAFLDHHNILVVEKNTGYVRLISDNKLRTEPLLKLNVSSQGERGLLGLAILNKSNSNDNSISQITSKSIDSEKDIKSRHPFASSLLPKRLPNSVTKAYVFFYLTELEKNSEARNVIYRFEWNGSALTNPKLIMESPVVAGIFHNGGKMIIGPRDHQLYVVIGDLNSPNTVMQNYKYGKKSSYSSVILRINPLTGLPSADNPFLNNKTTGSGITNITGLDYLYAYGIRNSFGLAFDPLTGSLWDTENGENTYDEINLVKPGFNSGWDKIMGPIARNNDTTAQNKLVDLPGSFYSDPKFSWRTPIGVTAIEFFNSSKFGTKYENSIFVGDINQGNIYYFEVNNPYRTSLNMNDGLHSELVDHVADNKNESLENLFATNFQGRITDIQTGPDGNLYILTYFDGKIYKIIHNSRSAN